MRLSVQVDVTPKDQLLAGEKSLEGVADLGSLHHHVSTRSSSQLVVGGLIIV